VTGRHVNPWLVLVLVCLAQFMVVLDATVVNVALPSIQNDLHMSESDLQWVVNAYTLVFGGFLLLGGRAGDLIGRKRIFLAGIVVFTAASLLDGLATSSTWLIVARGAQGLGGALVSPAALSIVNTTFNSEADRTKALGVWSAIAAGGGAVGLVIGGALTEKLSWPWVFFVNVPVGVATFILAARLIPESRAEGERRSFDVAGAVTVTAGLIALVYAIVRTSVAGWTSVETIGTGGLAVALLVAFVLIEQRSAAPLVRLDIFSVATLRAANLALLLVMSGLFAMFFFCSLYNQRVLGYSPIQAGLAFLPFTAGIVIGAVAAQQLSVKLGLKQTAILGLTISTVAVLWLIRLGPHGHYLPDLLPSILPASIGMGLAFVPLTLLATGGLPDRDAGLASGLFNTSQQVGGALGLAILSTVATSRTNHAFSAAGPDATVLQKAEALVHGFVGAFAGAAVFLAVGAVLLLLLLHKRSVGANEIADPATAAALES
jgi:EmrB/QacA subfamily drug resistance transporter